MAYAVIAHYQCPAHDAELITEALMAVREATLREPGNITYVVHRDHPADGAEGVAFTLYEQYVDRAAFDAHAASPHFAQHILGVVRPRLTSRTVHFCDVL